MSSASKDLPIKKDTYISLDTNGKLNAIYDLVAALYTLRYTQCVECESRALACDKRFNRLTMSIIILAILLMIALLDSAVGRAIFASFGGLLL